MAALEKPEVIPGQLTVDEVIAEVEAEEKKPLVFTSVTPSGLEVSYSPSPRRYYAVRDINIADSERTPLTEWQEVPSVTAVLGCLSKDGLSWWGQGVGVAGVMELIRRNIFGVDMLGNVTQKVDDGFLDLEPSDVVKLLTQHKLTVNHSLSKAGDRGTSVHDAFEQWAVNGTTPHPEIYPESEKGYVEGLVAFLEAFGPCWDLQAEVMVGSLANRFAGRYDLRCRWGGGPMVTKVYPKREDKVEELPAGRLLLDLKTSSNCYPSHALQLAAYELASVECGYEETDYRMVVRVTKDGQYEVRRTDATGDDFLKIRAAYDVMQKKMVA